MGFFVGLELASFIAVVWWWQQQFLLAYPTLQYLTIEGDLERQKREIEREKSAFSSFPAAGIEPDTVVTASNPRCKVRTLDKSRRTEGETREKNAGSQLPYFLLGFSLVLTTRHFFLVVISFFFSQSSYFSSPTPYLIHFFELSESTDVSSFAIDYQKERSDALFYPSPALVCVIRLANLLLSGHRSRSGF